MKTLFGGSAAVAILVLSVLVPAALATTIVPAGGSLYADHEATRVDESACLRCAPGAGRL